MKLKKTITNYLLPMLVLMMIFITSCDIGRGMKEFTYDDYLTMKYPKECKLDNKNDNGNNTNSFVLNEQNFVIMSEENISSVDKSALTNDKLKEIIKIYGSPFLEKGFQLVDEGIIKVGENDAYKVCYKADDFTVGYIFWFEKDNEPTTLYKIMFVYDEEHKDTVMQMIDSVELPYK